MPIKVWLKLLSYKGTFSIVLLALVDHNYNFTCIDIGIYGSNSDGGIFAKSSLKKALERNKLNVPHESVILGDEMRHFLRNL